MSFIIIYSKQFFQIKALTKFKCIPQHFCENMNPIRKLILERINIIWMMIEEVSMFTNKTSNENTDRSMTFIDVIWLQPLNMNLQMWMKLHIQIIFYTTFTWLLIELWKLTNMKCKFCLRKIAFDHKYYIQYISSLLESVLIDLLKWTEMNISKRQLFHYVYFAHQRLQYRHIRKMVFFEVFAITIDNLANNRSSAS